MIVNLSERELKSISVIEKLKNNKSKHPEQSQHKPTQEQTKTKDFKQITTKHVPNIQSQKQNDKIYTQSDINNAKEDLKQSLEEDGKRLFNYLCDEVHYWSIDEEVQYNTEAKRVCTERFLNVSDVDKRKIKYFFQRYYKNRFKYLKK